MEAKQHEPLSPKEGYVLSPTWRIFTKEKGASLKYKAKVWRYSVSMTGALLLMIFALIRGLHWAKVDSKVLLFLVHGIISNLNIRTGFGPDGEATVS